MTQRRDIREAGRIILAHGEATGHCHEVVTETGAPPELVSAQYFEEHDGTRTLLVLAPCELRHQEHAPITLTPDSTIQWRQGDVLGLSTGPGSWRIVRQQEWAGPEQWRQVQD